MPKSKETNDFNQLKHKQQKRENISKMFINKVVKK